MKTRSRMLWAGLFLMASAPAHAGDVVGLTAFTAGTPAKASEVNGNFNAVKTAVDDNHSRVTALESLGAAARLTALEAQFAAEVKCPANAPARFTDNGDDTVCDRDTGLMWEKKLAENDIPGNCADLDQANRNIRCVNNMYTWTATSSTLSDGTLYTDFLRKMNGGLSVSADGVTSTLDGPPPHAGYRDWRVPTVDELRSIHPLSGGPCASVCVDPIFGPWAFLNHVSSSSVASNLLQAWVVHAGLGTASASGKDNGEWVRAVRNGR